MLQARLLPLGKDSNFNLEVEPEESTVSRGNRITVLFKSQKQLSPGRSGASSL